MIEVRALTKRYGPTVAVDGLTFTVRPGNVTGFLGPNGSGKSTTMRMILGLDAPTTGTATVKGRPYRDLTEPLRTVGAVLDARAFHPGRRAHDHLRALALANGIPRTRVGEVLDLVGLGDPATAHRRAGGYSLGMGQRLGLAAALLGDPEVLILDEPVNGLDTDGIRWIRTLLRDLAAEGRTVLVSSHLLSEVEQTADRVVVIDRGRLVTEGTVAAVVEAGSRPEVVVRSPDPTGLGAALDRIDAGFTIEPDGSWRVTGADARTIGDLAAARGIALHELRPERSSLEDVYQELVAR